MLVPATVFRQALNWIDSMESVHFRLARVPYDPHDLNLRAEIESDRFSMRMSWKDYGPNSSLDVTGYTFLDRRIPGGYLCYEIYEDSVREAVGSGDRMIAVREENLPKMHLRGSDESFVCGRFSLSVMQFQMRSGKPLFSGKPLWKGGLGFTPSWCNLSVFADGYLQVTYDQEVEFDTMLSCEFYTPLEGASRDGFPRHEFLTLALADLADTSPQGEMEARMLLNRFERQRVLTEAYCAYLEATRKNLLAQLEESRQMIAKNLSPQESPDVLRRDESREERISC